MAFRKKNNIKFIKKKKKNFIHFYVKRFSNKILLKFKNLTYSYNNWSQKSMIKEKRKNINLTIKKILFQTITIIIFPEIMIQINNQKQYKNYLINYPYP